MFAVHGTVNDLFIVVLADVRFSKRLTYVPSQVRMLISYKASWNIAASTRRVDSVNMVYA